MKVKNLNKIKISLMKAVSETNKKKKTDYIIKSSATIVINELVKKAIIKHGIEVVLTSIYNDLLLENNAEVDSIGMWVNYNGKTYENSIQLQTLNNMEKLGEDDVNSIYEFFKLMSPPEEQSKNMTNE